ncbi:serine/threonine-protein phosphatase 6 regulatory ankyrin repeat subunit C-like, partial [Gigantopelta aegis]|uniref:serine/threonine-protein phosphatase 6 regulatory ankyrin repeat subunit C-like n=1 Tax=Gigantopelta aegis TaxID=1735272 RepID=UPI001B88B8D5
NKKLLTAAENGNLEEVRLALSEGANIDTQDKDGGTPLHFASQRGHVDTIRYLISQGADTTIKNKRGHTPMDKVKAHDPNRDEIIKFFDEKDETDETDRKNKNTPLHEAAWRGYTDIAQVLIEHGASLRATNTDKSLLEAIRFWRFRGVKSAIEKGADLNILDSDGSSPLHLACRGGHLETTGYLISKGANTIIKDKSGRTPVDEIKHHATNRG